jgi:hypothetical protein
MKKAQAASEFLMTYGWAFLAVMVTVSALAFFGVFNNKKFIEKCQSEFGMDCMGRASITTTGITIALKQNLGFKAEIRNLTSTLCNDKKGGVSGNTAPLVLNEDFVPFEVANNELFRLGLECELSKGESYSDIISFFYTNIETGLTYNVKVEVQGLVT